MKKLAQLLVQEHRNFKVSLNKKQAEDFADKLFRLLFRLDVNKCECAFETEHQLEIMRLELSEIIYTTLGNIEISREKASIFFAKLPEIYELLLADAEAIYQNDPASQQLEEVFVAYPGFYAIVIHRLAHLLWNNEVKLLARVWSEYAHSRTGIDIHPAAVIGKRFCIDHGTGIVIGETCIIGDDVKIFQGVTLGALSVSKEKANTDRHPKIGNNVVIYSGATILGGNTFIGDHSIIGGNVWITESIEPQTLVFYKNETIIKKKDFQNEPIFFHI